MICGGVQAVHHLRDGAQAGEAVRDDGQDGHPRPRPRGATPPPPAAAASWRGTRRWRECDGHATLRGARRRGAVGDERPADVLVAEAGREGVCRGSGGGG